MLTTIHLANMKHSHDFMILMKKIKNRREKKKTWRLRVYLLTVGLSSLQMYGPLVVNV